MSWWVISGVNEIEAKSLEFDEKFIAKPKPKPIYPLDDGPDDPLGAGRRGEGAHVAVVDAGPPPRAPRVHHADGLLPVLPVGDPVDERLQRLQERVLAADLVEDADHRRLVRQGLVHQVQLHVVPASTGARDEPTSQSRY